MAFVHKLFICFVLFTLLVDSFAATVYRKQRSIEDHHETKDSETKICENRSPCGWAVYKRTTRQIEFFMKNSCECSSKTKCVRDDDDISVAAYVYRCKPETKPNHPDSAS